MSSSSASAGSSNLLKKYDTPQHKSVAEFVKAQPFSTKFSFDGERGSGKSRLCMHPAKGGGESQCIDIALEARELFETMQKLSFFCQLPQAVEKTHITCERIPQ